MSLHHISIRYIAEEMDGPAGDLLWRAVPVYQAQIGINDTPITRALEDGNFKLAEKLILDNTDRSYLDEGPFVKIPLALVLSGDPEFRKHPRHLGIAKLLVECGADPNLRIPTSELQRASPSGMEYLINLISSTRDLVLLEGIPNPITPSQNLTKPRRTPEGAVIADITNPLRTIGLDGEEHLSPSDLREQLLSLLEIFLANGGDPNVTTTKSNSTLYHIVLSDYDPDIEVVMKLCEAGGDLNIPNGHGTTPLMDVISYADGDAALDVLHRIWERNPDISSLEAQNFANETALWRAMLAGSPKLAVELLQKGADPGNRARVYVARWHRIPYWDRVDRLFGVEASSNGVSALYAPLLQQSSPYKYHTAVYTYSKGLESIERPQPFNLSLMNKIIACAVYPVVDNTPTAKVFTPKVETELEQLLFSETKFDVNKILPRGMTRQDIGVLLLGNLKAGLQQLCVRKIMHQILFTKPVDVAFDMIDELKTDAKVVEPEKLKCPYHPEDNWDASHDDSSINSDLSSNDNEQDPNNIKDHWNLIHQLCPPIMRELVTSRLELPPVLVPHFEIEAARLQLGASIYTYEHVDCMLDWEGMSYVGSTDPFLENSVDEDVYEEYGGDDDDDDDDDNFDDGDDNDDDDEYYVRKYSDNDEKRQKLSVINETVFSLDEHRPVDSSSDEEHFYVRKKKQPCVKVVKSVDSVKSDHSETSSSLSSDEHDCSQDNAKIVDILDKASISDISSEEEIPVNISRDEYDKLSNDVPTTSSDTSQNVTNDDVDINSR